MSRVLSLFLSMSLVVAGMASAQTVKFGPQGEKVQATALGTVVAEAGESDLDFLLRRGKLFRGFTASTGFEACAQVCRAPNGRMGLSVYTSGAHIGCAAINVCPEGMTPTGETIHSHPQDRNVRSNDADRAFVRARTPGKHVPRYERLGFDEDFGFSYIDYESGPGYLVEGDNLFYQRGVGTVRRVGTIPPAE